MNQNHAPVWKRTLVLGLGVEAGLILLALGLASLLSVSPWLNSRLDMETVIISLLAVLPMLVALTGLRKLPIQSMKKLDQLVQRVVAELFQDSPLWVLALVSFAAGLGEEWLFRGVLQNWLSDAFHPAIAVGAAALVFGLAHAISRAYFAVSTLAGIYLGLLYVWSGNLWLPVLAHAFYDLVALVYYRNRAATE